jgi:hypothetical protein
MIRTAPALGMAIDAFTGLLYPSLRLNNRRAAPDTLGKRWWLLGLRSDDSGSVDRWGAWSPEAPERSSGCRGGDDGCVALLLGLWRFRLPLGDVNSRKRDGRDREIEIRAAGLRFRLELDHLPRDC